MDKHNKYCKMIDLNIKIEPNLQDDNFEKPKKQERKKTLKQIFDISQKEYERMTHKIKKR